MAKPKTSSRAERRALARSLEKLAETRVKLAALSPGGTPANPIDVPSASVVELRAGEFPCLRCQERCTVAEHAAETVGGARLRAARLSCRVCGGSRRVWFRIVEAKPN